MSQSKQPKTPDDEKSAEEVLEQYDDEVDLDALAERDDDFGALVRALMRAAGWNDE